MADIQVKVVFHGMYRIISGTRVIHLKLKNVTLNDLLIELENLYGKELTGQLINFETGEVWPLMAVAINGQISSDKDGFNIKLMEGDEIVFLPPALGG